MDGKIFIFDLQRFDNVWSVSSATAESLIYGAGETFIASLTTSGSSIWSLSASSGTVSIDASASDNSEAYSLVASSINGATTRTIFDASSVMLPFYFKFASSTPITSITGGNGGASIDASALNKSGTFYLDGGTGSDSLVAGSSKSDTFYLNGGNSGADTLVGGSGSGIDYFIFDGNNNHTASIQSYTAGQDFISLTSSALPGATSVAADSNDLVLAFSESSSLNVLGANTQNSIVTVIKDNATYYYSKDYISTGDYTSVSLTSGADTFTALGSNFSTKAVTIDAQAASVGNGVNVTLNNKGDYFIGSSKGNSITGGTGNDQVSLGNGTDIFYYKGGADSILDYGTGTDSIQLNASKLSLITDGTKLASLSDQEGFELTFGTGNTLTFKEPTGAVSIYDSNGAKHYDYTSTAISLAGSGADPKGQVTLGSSFNETSFDGSAFSVISAAAVPSISGGFKITAVESVSSYIIGSDYKFTSIMGSSVSSGTANDTLQAGAAGASLNGNGGNDLLIGSSKKDYFYFSSGKASIQNYTYSTVESDSDVVAIAESLTAPTSSFGDSINYGGSDFVVSLGNDNALTFKAKQQFALAKGDSIYTYAPGSVALQYVDSNNTTIQGITIGGSYYKAKSFNGASDANADYVTIDASAVNHKITVRGNNENNYLVASSLYGGTLLGGLGQDTLVAGSVGAYMDGGDGDVLYIGGAGNDTFVYSGNAASIQNYGAGDVVNFTASDITINAASVSAASYASGSDTVYNLTLNFDDSNKIIFQSLTSEQATNGVSLKSGSSNLYVYRKDSVTWNDKSITLTADYAGMKIGDPATAASIYTAADNSLTTIDAHLVGKNIEGDALFSIAGNAYGNYIIGSESKANSISGGAGNDTIIGNTVTSTGDVFHYTAGNDVILGFDGEDKFSIGGSYSTDDIAKAKASRNHLTFTIDKENSIAFRSYESTDVPARISLDGAGGGFLTKDGVVSSITSDGHTDEYSLKLFGSAKGTIDLNDTLYSDSGKTIASVNAIAATKQGLTIVAKSVAGGANYNFYSTNNKRDTFVYDAGAVSITGFESGKDRLNIADDTITSFSISGGTNGTGGTVIISLNGGQSDIISLSGAQGNEILVRQNGARGYSKMVFRDSGVLENKTKNPTSVTLATGAASYSAVDTVKKITVTDISQAVSIYAGAKGSLVDASDADKGVSLIGGAKVDKFTGSSANEDTFVFNTDSGGKDIFNGFVAIGDGNVADSIEFSDGGASLLSGAKISASNKAVKFKFGTKNVLTLKGDNLKDAKLQIDGTEYTYGKNSIAEGSRVSLTSKFGGTYKVAGDVNYVDGSLSEKNLMFKATSANTNETLKGGTKKTTFKGNGGTDSLIGGSGDDIFFYAKGDTGTAHIANFDFKNDKLKIASGTLRKIETIDGGISFNMSTKNDKDDPVIGYFNIESSYDKSSGKTTALDADKSKTLIHANNRYYWFAQENFTETVTTAGSSEGETIAITAGDLIGYSDKNISSSQAKDYAVIELNYGTNLVKSGVATLVSSKNDKATLPGTAG